MNNYKKKLMSKNGRVTMVLAREMLTYYEGDRIRTVGEYAEIFDTARGTVQSALKFLQQIEAIALESRGHLGTYIVKIDYRKLWDISDLGVIMGVMPLPYSKRYEGLATGFYKTFEKGDIPFSLAFMRGSTKRIEALTLGKYNFAIVSKLAATLEMQKSNSIEIIHEFAQGSYVGNHVIILRDSKQDRIKDGMKVALDPMSTDQIILTAHECEGIDVEYIETPYNQILQKIKNNEVDAAVWNIDEIKEKHLEYNICPLTNPKTKEIGKEDTIATIVVSKENEGFRDIFKRFINMKEVEEIQGEVIDNNMIPIY
ncbi:GntR family transcriptional regulator YhfZ [Clostridium sediminicola]|uniref:GntR family transcriptional regulator YhfZ n=1 Tax=Clostridium sediminicola TaxID=3114879 RepID=UPI0031F22F95